MKAFAMVGLEDSYLPFVNETSGLGLVLGLLPRSIEFSGEDLARFID